MSRSRFVSAVFVVLCFGAAGFVLHEGYRPLLSPADAQAAVGPAPGMAMRAAKPADRKAAVAAIQAQLQAFQKGNYQKAVQYQSAGLKQNFADISEFQQMMENTYPEFAHYKKAQFGAARADAAGLHLFIPVTITGQDGVTVQAAYMMVREGKAYRVEGVVGGGHRPVPIAPEASTSA